MPILATPPPGPAVGTAHPSGELAASERAVLDGARMTDALGYELELVHPRWWRVDRWFVWMFLTNGWIAIGGERVRIRTTRGENDD